MTHASRILFMVLTMALSACGKKAPAPRTAEEIAQKTAETNEQIQKTTQELTKLNQEKDEASVEADQAKEKLADAQSAEGKDKPSEKTIETLKVDVEKKAEEATAAAEQSAQVEKELAALKAEREKLAEEARALEAEKARQAQVDAEQKAAAEQKSEEAKLDMTGEASDGLFSLTNLLPSTSLFTIHKTLPVRLGTPVFYPVLKTKLPAVESYTRYVRLNDDTFASVSWINEGLHILRFKATTTTGDASERSFLDVPLKDLKGYFRKLLDVRVTDKGGLDVLFATSESIVVVHLNADLTVAKKYSVRLGDYESDDAAAVLLNDDTIVWTAGGGTGEISVANAKFESSVSWCRLPQRGYTGGRNGFVHFDRDLTFARAKDKNQVHVFSQAYARGLGVSLTRRVLLVEVNLKVEGARRTLCDGLRVVRETDWLDLEGEYSWLDRVEGDAYYSKDHSTRIFKPEQVDGIAPFESEKTPTGLAAKKTVSEESYSQVAPMAGAFAAAYYSRLDFLNSDIKVEKSYKHSSVMNSLKTIDSETKVVAATDVEGNLLLVDGITGSLLEQREVLDKAKGQVVLNENHYISGDTIIVPVILQDGSEVNQIGFIRVQKKSK